MSEITIDEMIKYVNEIISYEGFINGKEEIPILKAILKILNQSKSRIYTQNTIDALKRDIDILQQQSDKFYNELKKLKEAKQREGRCRWTPDTFKIAEFILPVNNRFLYKTSCRKNNSDYLGDKEDFIYCPHCGKEIEWEEGK